MAVDWSFLTESFKKIYELPSRNGKHHGQVILYGDHQDGYQKN